MSSDEGSDGALGEAPEVIVRRHERAAAVAHRCAAASAARESRESVRSVARKREKQHPRVGGTGVIRSHRLHHLRLTIQRARSLCDKVGSSHSDVVDDGSLWSSLSLEAAMPDSKTKDGTAGGRATALGMAVKFARLVQKERSILFKRPKSARDAAALAWNAESGALLVRWMGGRYKGPKSKSGLNGRSVSVYMHHIMGEVSRVMQIPAFEKGGEIAKLLGAYKAVAPPVKKITPFGAEHVAKVLEIETGTEVKKIHKSPYSVLYGQEEARRRRMGMHLQGSLSLGDRKVRAGAIQRLHEVTAVLLLWAKRMRPVEQGFPPVGSDGWEGAYVDGPGLNQGHVKSRKYTDGIGATERLRHREDHFIIWMYPAKKRVAVTRVAEREPYDTHLGVALRELEHLRPLKETGLDDVRSTPLLRDKGSKGIGESRPFSSERMTSLLNDWKHIAHIKGGPPFKRTTARGARAGGTTNGSESIDMLSMERIQVQWDRERLGRWNTGEMCDEYDRGSIAAQLQAARAMYTAGPMSTETPSDEE